jgi:hypothetical protein
LWLAPAIHQFGYHQAQPVVGSHWRRSRGQIKGKRAWEETKPELQSNIQPNLGGLREAVVVASSGRLQLP